MRSGRLWQAGPEDFELLSMTELLTLRYLGIQDRVDW
jgi:hypothetical protein